MMRYSIVNDTIKHDYFDTITIKCNERDTFNNIINEANKRQIFLRTSLKIVLFQYLLMRPKGDAYLLISCFKNDGTEMRYKRNI